MLFFFISVKSFYVQPQDSPTMVKINAIFPCHLQLVHSEVRLISAMDGKVLGMWPFKCIRRYKFDGNVFCIEAGRKAPTGQGLFQFISNECSEIYRVMDNIIRSKAVDPTTQRPASSKIQKAPREKHNLVRKTQSVPPTPPKPIELHYDYASPECNILGLPDSNAPQASISTLPKQCPSTERGLEAENSYDVLYPIDPSPKDDSFESHFSNLPDTMSKLEQSNSYDTLQFNTLSTSQGNNDFQAQASGGVYDTLQFDQHDGKASHVKGGRSGSYDKLQFNRSPNNLTSFEGGTCGDNKTDGFESCDGTTSDNVYNTLSHLQVSQPADHANVNTYDSLADSSSSCQPNANTYDSLADTKTSVERLPDHMTDKRPKHPVPEKPVAPARPPPRKKLGGSQDKVAQSKKPAAPSKPVRVPKQRRDSPDSNDGNSAPNTTQENLKEIMQQKLTQPDDDNGAYATIDHDYASIDYSKVAKSDSEPPTDAVYSEPYNPGSKPIPSNVPKPAKLKVKTPKVMKNIFRKNQALPKPKTPTDGDVHFADELKRKLGNQLKKSDGATTRGGPSTRTDSSSPATAQGHNPDEGIYDEVNNSTNTYSLPFDKEMDV